MSQAAALLDSDYGHVLIVPWEADRAIKVPSWVFPALRKLGLLLGRTNKLTQRVYEFIDPVNDPLARELRMVLGRDLSGPDWLVCKCDRCQKVDRAGRAPDLGSQVAQDVMKKRITHQLPHKKKTTAP